MWGRRWSSVGAVSGQRNDGVRVVRGLHLGEGLKDVLLNVLGFVLVDALVFVLVDECVFVLTDALVVILVQILGYVLVEALVCVPVAQLFQPVKQT